MSAGEQSARPAPSSGATTVDSDDDDAFVRNYYQHLSAEDLASYEVDTLTQRIHRHRELAATRERGYSIDDRETNPGVYAMALLIPGRRLGDEPLALGVSMMEAMATDKARQQTLEHLREARAHLTSPQQIFSADDQTPGVS